jgi:iron complex outermembrane receptor protein
MKRTLTGIPLAVAIALNGGLALPSAAVAQTAALEEIVVTAERRETSLQNTPLSLAALSADAMERKGVEDIADIALFTPNLAINGSRGSGNNQPTFSIRGISGGGGATSERGVALYIDDIYVPRTNGSVFKVFDLDRVEVLRGPQGTLFGRNSEGGAIRLVTKQPTQNFDAYVRANVGNFSHQDLVGMVNLPLSDEFAVRIQAGHLKEDGYVRRGTQLMGGETDKLARIQALYTPNQDVKITLGALYSDAKSNGTPNVMTQWDMSPGITGVLQGNYADWMSDWLANAGQARLATVNDPRLVKADPYAAPDFCFLDNANPDFGKACEQYNNSKYYQFDGKLSWNINADTTLKWSSGYAVMNNKGVTDWQFLGTEIRPNVVQSTVYNHELLINWTLFGGKIDLVTGLNFFQEESSTDSYVVNAKGTSVYNGTTGGSANGDAYAGLYISGNGAVAQKTNAWGQFDSLTWHLTDKLNFTTGVRVSQDTKQYETTRRAGSGPTPSFVGMPAANDFVPSYAGASGATSITVNGQKTWTVVDWRETVDYHFTQDIMGYATASKAFKDGQYSYTVLATQSGPAQSSVIKPIDPEKVVNLEAGLRTTWLDGRLRINPTGFWMAWTNRQSAQQQTCSLATDPTCPSTGFRIVTVNSGDVDVYGLELDAQFAVTSHLTLEGALGTTKYRLKDIVANKGPYLFPDQPTPTYNFGVSYSVPGTSLGDFTANLNYAYQGTQQTYPGSLTTPAATIDSSYELPSYGLINGRVQLTTANKANVISVYANNLADKVYSTYATSFGGGYWDSGAGTGLAAPPRHAIQSVMGRPREFGIQLQHNFN